MFANIYDELMADIDYEQLLLFIEGYLNKNQLIIDAGCGSGYFLRELLKHGYDALGIDRDDQMLALANERLRSENLKAALYNHDLKDEISMKVDVVVSFFDVMNYFKGVKRIFKNIKRALNKEGLFIFDVYKESVLHEYDGYSEEESEPFPYQWTIKSESYKLKHIIRVNQEEHKLTQYVKPLTYYTHILEKLGFNEVLVKEGPDIRKHYIIARL